MTKSTSLNHKTLSLCSLRIQDRKTTQMADSFGPRKTKTKQTIKKEKKSDHTVYGGECLFALTALPNCVQEAKNSVNTSSLHALL